MSEENVPMSVSDVLDYIIVSEHELSRIKFTPNENEDEKVNELKTVLKIFLTSLGMVLHSCSLLDKFDTAKYDLDYMKQITDLPAMIQKRKEQMN